MTNKTTSAIESSDTWDLPLYGRLPRRSTTPWHETSAIDLVERERAWSFFDRLDGPLKSAFDALSDDDKSEAVDQLEDAFADTITRLQAALKEARHYIAWQSSGFSASKSNELVTKIDAVLSSVGGE